MLPRAALRSITPNPLYIHCRPNGFSKFTSHALRARSFASRKPPPPPPSARPPKPPRPQQFTPSASGQARQTSPGTAVPKDQTWKPKDAIKFGAPAAATSGTGSAAKPAASPVEGARPDDRSSKRESVLEGDAGAPQEPIAQKMDADAPAPDSIRGQAQGKIAESENTPPPEAPSQPLPDLRQGIPSTFEFEFGDKKRQSTAGESEDGKSGSEQAEEGKQRERAERDYDQSTYETSLDRRRAQMANYLYASILFLTITGAFYIARPYSVSDDIPEGLDTENASGWAPGKMYARMRARWGSQVAHYTEPVFPKLLPDMPEDQRAPFTLVVSLEDVLIHSSWDTKHGYRVAKRPGLDYFVRYLSPYFEIVLFTNSNLAIVDPLIKKLDPYHFMWPLGREHTKYEKGEYIKDLSYLNRPISKTLIIDTNATAVKNQPENAVILPKWNGDPKDAHANDLVALIPFLEHIATMGIEDVRTVIKSFEGQSIPEEFARREAEARKRFLEQRDSEQKRRPRYSLGSVAGALGVKSGGMGGGMMLADGTTVAEGYAQGKMLSDQIREQGQRQYEQLEQRIREQGEEWLRQEKEEEKRQMEAFSKDMKKGALSWFTGGGDKKE